MTIIRGVMPASFTRPTNTTGYALGDAVSNSDSATTPLEFAGVSKSGYITKVAVQTDQATFSTPLRVHFFTAAPTAANDNAAFTTTYAEAGRYLGSVDTPGGGSAGVATNSEARLAFTRASQEGSKLYALVEARGAFTPASGQKFTIHIALDSDG